MYPATISQCYKTPASACQPIARRYAVFSPEEPSATKRNLSANKGIQRSFNTPVAGNRALANIWQSEDHTLIDMGDDDFTRGKPHPMIDPTLRNQRLLNELNDSHTAVVLFDLVLGYGASTTPASELLDQLSHIDMNNAPLLIAHVCGTEADPQIRSQQISALQNAGVIIASSNAQAALWASTVAQTQLQKKGLNA